MINWMTSLSAAVLLLVPALGIGQTHLGVPPSRIVNLRYVVDSEGICEQRGNLRFSFKRVRSNGSFEDQAYVVPAGNQLVITDITWLAEDDSGIGGFTVDQPPSFVLRATSSNFYVNGEVYESPPSDLGGVTRLRTGGSENLTAGIVVNAGRRLCGQVLTARIGGAGSGTIVRAQVRGYLIRL